MSTAAETSGILVGVDGSEYSDAAVRWAVREAALRCEPMTLMTVSERSQPFIATYDSEEMMESRQKQHAEGDRILAAARQIVDADGDHRLGRIHTLFRFAHPLSTLIETSWDMRLAVVGSRGKGVLGRLTLGSISSGLAGHAYCPVAVIHPGNTEPDPHAPILLGIDGSPASESATAIAFDEACRRGAPLIAMHAWENTVAAAAKLHWGASETTGAKVLGERLIGWQEKYPDVHVTPTLVHENPARWLVNHSGSAQLVIVGNHGRDGLTGMLLGSVSNAVVHAAEAPVIVAR